MAGNISVYASGMGQSGDGVRPFYSQPQLGLESMRFVVAVAFAGVACMPDALFALVGAQHAAAPRCRWSASAVVFFAPLRLPRGILTAATPAGVRRRSAPGLLKRSLRSPGRSGPHSSTGRCRALVPAHRPRVRVARHGGRRDRQLQTTANERELLLCGDRPCPAGTAMSKRHSAWSASETMLPRRFDDPDELIKTDSSASHASLGARDDRRTIWNVWLEHPRTDLRRSISHCPAYSPLLGRASWLAIKRPTKRSASTTGCARPIPASAS